MVRLAWAFVRRDCLLAVSYQSAFVMQVLWIVLTVPVLFYFSQMLAGTTALSLEPYGGQYFPFLLIGAACQDYLTFSQSTFHTSIREHQLMGTLEIVLLSPTPVPLILVCSSLWGYIFTSIRFALYLLLGLAFGLDLSHANLLSFLLVTSFSVVSLAALGLLTAALTLIIKRSEAITMLMTAATVALGGVMYPVSVLPLPLQWVAQLLPFTYALSGMRTALLTGAGPEVLLPELSALLVLAALLFPLGLWAFTLALRNTKVTGTLGQY